MSKKNEQYSLFTAISMIVGICIGSGIFFKADDVLRATGGNVTLGVIIFVMGALGITFGSISLSELAGISSASGGVVGFFQEFISPKASSAFAWFQTFLYLPTINVVVSWVAGIYTLQILGIDFSLEVATLIGTAYLLFFYGVNYLSMRFGAAFQSGSTFIKLIPLILIAVLGVLNGQGVSDSSPDTVQMGSSFAWLAALAPMAFSYDGWTVVLNISPQIKNGKRNVPLALFIGPLVVLVAYLAYFIGLVTLLGSEQVLSLGDNAIYTVGKDIFGQYGGIFITLFILISILGVSNGMTMGSIRMPEVLANKQMLPQAFISNDLTLRPAKNSMLVSLVIALVWMAIHYVTQRYDILKGGDVSELAITFSYLCYLILYVKILNLRKTGVLKKSFKNSLAPLLGILSSLMIFLGSFIAHPVTTVIFIGFCSFVCVLGYLFYQRTASAD